MKFKLALLTILFSIFSYAQNKGSVSGTITDKEAKNAPLPFANVLVKNTQIAVTTNENGGFTLNLEPGNYTLQLSFIGYENLEVPISLKAGETTIINKALGSGNYTLKDVVVKSTTKNREKESALLLEQKKAVEIKQSIGAQEMSRKGVSDVASAVSKVTGITKQEDSGNIYVRGLGDRYNSTTMNGLPLPSNNPNKKNIKLDIFNTDIVESIGIDKTYNYKNFGDFAGANIDIVSKNYTGKEFVELGLEMGVNTLVMKKNDFVLQEGPSKTGFSDITYPKDPFSTYNFENKWNDESANSPINNSYAIKGGNSYSVGQTGKLGFFISTSFDNEYSYRSGIARGSINVQGDARRDLKFESFGYGTNTTLLGNINFKINKNHSLQFNSILINSSSQKNDQYKGIIDIFDNASEGGGFIRRATFDQTTLNINQLLGKHTFAEKFIVNWGLSYNKVKNVIPDRMTNTLIPQDNSNLDVLIVANNNDSENNRFFQNLKDNEFATNFSIDYKFNKSETGSKGKISIGYNGRFKEIKFEAIQFNFDINTGVAQPVVDINNIDGYFNQTNFASNLFKIQTFNTGLTPQIYNGKQFIYAGFLGLEYKLTPRFTAVIATRTERIYQKIDWGTNLGSGNDLLKKIKILPNTTLKYEVNDKNNLKFAASKSYTLPQFKERAPFQYEEIDEVTFGNPDLYVSNNYNADLKWEYFPKATELISVTAFGKIIQNPINEITVASATNDISYVNTGKKAQVIGAEFEIRKNIFEIDTTLKENLNFGFNASYMFNNQDFDSQKVIDETDLNVFFSKTEGKLTGASDLLLNGDISYFKELSKDRNILATLAYNYFSDRIYSLGTNEKGDLIDKAVGTLDLILKTKLTKNLSFGFSAKNLLDPTVERFQDKQDVLVKSYKKGVNFKFAIAYKF
jgi:CarboxypepD_reg-like domain/TonB-dependent Receptor Plug Domain